MKRLRIGAVSYLNTKPLIHELNRLASDAELVLDYPSRLAQRLASGDLDVGLIPIVEYFRADGYRLVPGISISSHGSVLSVTLFSRKPWSEIETVALDEGSRTRAALAQVILRHRYGVRPRVRPLGMDEEAEQAASDAVLLIGDRAMHACLPGFAYAFDLGQEWHDWTGLPFVYAAWAVRGGVDLGPVESALHESKRRGQANIGAIAAAEASRLGLDAGFCRRYLANIIRYELGPREQAGMERFYALASELDFVPRGRQIEFYRATVAA